MLMKKLYLFLFLVAMLLTSSCASKRTSYFQDLNEETKRMIVDLDSAAIGKETLIRPKDELMIVISSADPDAAAPFNLYFRESRLSGSGSQGVSSSEDRKFVTYQVDNLGYVNLPTLGKVKLTGLTIDEAISYLEDILKKHLRSPIVNIQISNFRVSVIGAVNAPGAFYFVNQRVSLLDAIASARDLTLQARRDNILLIRTNEKQKEYIRFDLTKSDLITSPYFYLQQNDIIYVEPNKAVQQDATMSERKRYNLTIITSAISTIISTVSLIIAINK